MKKELILVYICDDVKSPYSKHLVLATTSARQAVTYIKGRIRAGEFMYCPVGSANWTTSQQVKELEKDRKELGLRNVVGSLVYAWVQFVEDGVPI